VKLEIIKKYDAGQDKDFYHVYVDDNFIDLAVDIDKAFALKDRVIADMTNPKKDKVVYTQEF